jgi:hypothetical protein
MALRVLSGRSLRVVGIAMKLLTLHVVSITPIRNTTIH